MSEQAAVGVVLVHWNQAERCRATIDRFRAQDVPVELCIVDNGSRPEELARLRRGLSADEVTIVELGHNAGFGPAANEGMRRWLKTSEGSWIVVAPHDALPEPDCLARLVAAGSHRPNAGLVSADVGDGKAPIVDPYFGGITLPPDVVRTRLARDGRDAGAAPEPDGWERVGYPHGTMFLARRELLTDIGLFDERYFAYCEEADLGERARRVGWEVGLVRGARVRNPYQAGGSPVVDYLQLRNTLLLVREHFGRYHAGIRLLIAIGHLVSGCVVPSRRPPVFCPKARLRAVRDWATGRFGPPPPSIQRRSGR